MTFEQVAAQLGLTLFTTTDSQLGERLWLRGNLEPNNTLGSVVSWGVEFGETPDDLLARILENGLYKTYLKVLASQGTGPLETSGEGTGEPGTSEDEAPTDDDAPAEDSTDIQPDNQPSASGSCRVTFLTSPIRKAGQASNIKIEASGWEPLSILFFKHVSQSGFETIPFPVKLDANGAINTSDTSIIPSSWPLGLYNIIVYQNGITRNCGTWTLAPPDAFVPEVTEQIITNVLGVDDPEPSLTTAPAFDFSQFSFAGFSGQNVVTVGLGILLLWFLSKGPIGRAGR